MMRAGPPRLLQIHRETVTSGAEEAYRAIETETARLCSSLGCPHVYLALQALAEPHEVWFLNGFDSTSEQQLVIEAYAGNSRLMEALTRNGQRKAALTTNPLGVVASCRADLSRGTPWTMGQGRFLVVTANTTSRTFVGTVFEAPDGTHFDVRAAATLVDAEATAGSAGPPSRILAIRTSWSFPAPEWIAADPDLWKGVDRSP
jgi:hypothetical protein